MLGRGKKKNKKEDEKQLQPPIQLPSIEDEGAYEELARESEMLSPEEAQAKIAMQLGTKPENIELMAELTKEEQIRLASLMTVGDIEQKRYGSSMINDFVDNYLSLSVSLRRGGRSEVVDVARPGGIQRDTMRRSLKDMLMGRQPMQMR